VQVRRFVAIVATTAVALAAPSAAEAGKTTSYDGAFAPSGALQFDVKQTSNGKKVLKFRWTDFPLACRGGPETSSSRLRFAVDVSQKRFRTSAVDDQDHPGALLKLNGKLIGQDAAVGSMRIRGDRVPIDRGTDKRKQCDSGRLRWTATAL